MWCMHIHLRGWHCVRSHTSWEFLTVTIALFIKQCPDAISARYVNAMLYTWFVQDAGLILSVQSNQFVQSKMQFVQSKMRNCAVQKHKVEDIIVQFSKSTNCVL